MAIDNINTPWERHSGEEVEEFIKGRLSNADQRIGALEENAVKAIQKDEDTDNVTLSFVNEKGETQYSVTVPKGADDTGNSVTLTSAIYSGGSQVSNIKIGGTARLMYTFTRLVGGQPDEGYGDLSISIRRNNVEIYSEVVRVQSQQQGTFDLTPYLDQSGTIGVYLIAEAYFDTAEPIRKPSYASIEVVNLQLSSTFNPAALTTSGGAASQIAVTCSLVGTGERSLFYYIDGVEVREDPITSQNSTVSRQLIYQFSKGENDPSSNVLSPGRHSLQVVAMRSGMRSNSLYYDFLVSGGDKPYVGIIASYEDGRIYGDGQSPVIEAEQYVPFSFRVNAWNDEDIHTSVLVYRGNTQITTLSVERGVDATFSYTLQSQGEETLRLVAGETEYQLSVNVVGGGIDVSETIANLIAKLVTDGRSNNEEDPAVWGEGSVFEDMDWRSSGWVVDAEDGAVSLRLANGAKVITGIKPFLLSNAKQSGITVEMEFRVNNVMDRDMPLIHCGHIVQTEDPDAHKTVENWKGISITPELAACYTGGLRRVPTAETDDQGETIVNTTAVGTAMSVVSGMWIKAAFVISPNVQGSSSDRLMELYLNGVRSKADLYDQTDSWNDIDLGITFDSRAADLEVRTVRVYGRALSDTEELENYMVDRKSLAGIKDIYERNQVIKDGKVDYSILRQQDKGVLVIVRANGIDPVNATNDKGKDFLVDKAYWYSPLGEEYDFVAENFNMRIQGTSSTKYPRKNYRLYLGKGNGHKLYVYNDDTGSVDKETDKYKMRKDSIGSNLFCMKVDYSDSSMAMNTGGAKLFDKTMRELGILTPPQGIDDKVRQSIDGIPCDIFVATTDGGEATYIGQYNFNNEKSKSGKIFGMEGNGMVWECPITFEGLHNANPFCLFQPAGKATFDGENYNADQDLAAQLESDFDWGFEFNYPEDVWWSERKARKELKLDDGVPVPEKNLATQTQRNAVIRLMSWIRECMEDTVGYKDDHMTLDSPDYGDRNGWPHKEWWQSDKFADEVGQYFDLDNLLTYYLITEYWGSVDQRAKNILWRTWDGLIWYATYYDGDTAMGKRNDSYLVYPYDMTRDTWDKDHAKFAYEGHNSWLWCLVLANLGSQLEGKAQALRTVLDFKAMDKMFTDEQQHNWCETLYNRSGKFKYIDPAIEGVPLDVDGQRIMQTYNFMFALTGNMEAHRTLFLRERGLLLDAKYMAGGYLSDLADFYLNRSENDEPSVFVVTSNGRFTFGMLDDHNTPLQNVPFEDIGDGETMSMEVTGTLTMSNPYKLVGASHFGKLDLTGCADKLTGGFNLSKCALLRELDASLPSEATTLSPNFNIDGCKVLETIDVTNLKGVRFDNLDKLTRLRVFRAGGTNLQAAVIAPGAPIEELVLPAASTALWLREFRHLTMNNLTVEGYSNISSLIVTGCPNLDAMEIAGRCPNLQRMRLGGLSGKVSLDSLLHWKDKGIDGYNSLGDEVNGVCPCTGEVWLDRVASPSELAGLREYYEGLTIHQCPYSHYWYDDEENDPANITNEDNKTGYGYYNPVTQLPTWWEGTADAYLQSVGWNSGLAEYLIDHPNCYIASGHVALLHDKCQPCIGEYDGGIMTVTRLNKDDYTKTADGGNANITGTNDLNIDVYVYIPRYWYKGVNEYKTGRKHFFLTTEDPLQWENAKKAVCKRKQISQISSVFPNTAVKVEGANCISEGSQIAGQSDLTSMSGFSVCKFDVDGMKQVRFPSYNNSRSSGVKYGYAFVGDDDRVIAESFGSLAMNEIENNPADFDASLGDYDFRNVPEGAKWLWFTFSSQVPNDTEVIATDSNDLESIEPDWVEHKSELVGAYLGYVPFEGTIGNYQKVVFVGVMRSISGVRPLNQNPINQGTGDWRYDSDGYPVAIPTTEMSGTLTDRANFCLVRGRKFGFMPFETRKELVNLFAVWYGTRKFSDITGKRQVAGDIKTGASDSRNFDGLPWAGANEASRVWGIEDFCAFREVEATDKAFFVNTDWENFFKTHRAGNISSTLTIVRSDGTESKILGAWKGSISVEAAYEGIARVFWGRYCDIVVKTRTGIDSEETFSRNYASYQGTPQGAIPAFHAELTIRSNPYTMIGFQSNNTQNTYTNVVRLCYTGEISNEQDLLNINE